MRGVVFTMVVAATLIVGCGSSSAPSAAALAGSAAPPTQVPGAITAPPAGAAGTDLTAQNIDFEPKELVASAGPVTIAFHNRDAGVPHNLEVKDASGTIYKSEVMTGPSDTQEPIGDLAAGSYTFVCSVHPNMTGTLTVTP